MHAHTHIEISVISPCYPSRVRKCPTLSQQCRCIPKFYRYSPHLPCCHPELSKSSFMPGNREVRGEGRSEKKALQSPKVASLNVYKWWCSKFWGSLEGRHTQTSKIACVRVKFRVEKLRVHNIDQANEPSALQTQTERYLLSNAASVFFRRLGPVRWLTLSLITKLNICCSG